MRYLLFICFFSFLGISSGSTQVFDTVFVHFEIGESKPLRPYEDSLNLLANRLLATPHQKILVYGFADYLGTSKPNFSLSQQRAQTVAEILQQKNIKADRFLVIAGLGQQQEKGNDNQPGNFMQRKVMILLPQRAAIPAVTATPIERHEEPVDKAAKTPLVARKEAVGNISAAIDKTALNEVFVLENIYFHLHTADLMPESLPVLQALLSLMHAKPQLKISIEGHICCNVLEGSDPSSVAYLLSIYRAKKIYDYLLLNNIDASRIRYRGFGRTQPLFPDELTEAEMDANRRVEIRVVAK